MQSALWAKLEECEGGQSENPLAPASTAQRKCCSLISIWPKSHFETPLDQARAQTAHIPTQLTVLPFGSRPHHRTLSEVSLDTAQVHCSVVEKKFNLIATNFGISRNSTSSMAARPDVAGQSKTLYDAAQILRMHVDQSCWTQVKGDANDTIGRSGCSLK